MKKKQEQVSLWDNRQTFDAVLPGRRPLMDAVFEYGKAHGFPEFLFDLRFGGGIIQSGEEKWKQVYSVVPESHYYWLEDCYKAVRKLMETEI